MGWSLGFFGSGGACGGFGLLRQFSCVHDGSGDDGMGAEVVATGGTFNEMDFADHDRFLVTAFKTLGKNKISRFFPC